MEALQTELVQVEVDVHNFDLVAGRVQALQLQHLLWLDQTAQAEAQFLLAHPEAFKRSLAEDAHCVSLEHLLQRGRILLLGLRDRLRKVAAVEFA